MIIPQPVTVPPQPAQAEVRLVQAAEVAPDAPLTFAQRRRLARRVVEEAMRQESARTDGR